MIRHTLRVKTAPRGRVDTPLRAQSRVPVGRTPAFRRRMSARKEIFSFYRPLRNDNIIDGMKSQYKATLSS
jgi:hypothetical protein